MAGPVETSGEVAKATIEGLRASPALLALVVMQIIILGIIAWNAHERNIYETNLNQLLVTLCKRAENPQTTASFDPPCQLKPM